MSEADASFPATAPALAPTRRARGVAMTAGLVMTPLLIAAALWVDRAALMDLRAGLPAGLARAELRQTIAPDSAQR